MRLKIRFHPNSCPKEKGKKALQFHKVLTGSTAKDLSFGEDLGETFCE
jgi:hypothetical protein